ncbi:conserved hypothetical protein [Leishmania major strain Friedlin]|uniref:CRAL-TRIO domain-containing protein n=1 Tax=Leishmania major TaxID=5664 RepID=Q4Q5F5_LEIMA|nr:conserved hypothetical protein [Leishmania major strain Friedlin]CAG9580183.1 CRAL/TRIO_domain_containing_protein_-_putative [Leishmania major strain Friedlin]CAJ08647.1 conserved hypothetical protein [Leishmania major strain Friedlin]|eukprot:XP_001685443.1 conserved hypothetical protein [Leishmania major strain Friedlin]
MNGTQSPAVERFHTSYKDSDLLSSATDSIDLNHEDEHQVTDAIKTLQQLLKRSTVNDNTPTTPTDAAADSAAAMEYLADFSYGLTPGEARYIVYRFLKATGMNIRRALEQMMRSAERRRKHNLNNMALFPCIIPMRGFNQRTVCYELRLPFISNISSGKSCLDPEGRLRLEHEQLDYGNAHYEDPYTSLMTTGAAADSRPLSPDGSDCLSSQPAMSAPQVASSSPTLPIGPANGKATLEGDGTAERERDAALQRSSLSPKEHRRKSDENKRDGSRWRSFMSLIPFLRHQGTGSPSNASGSHLRNMSTVTSETRRHRGLHSILSTCSGSDCGNSGAREQNYETPAMKEEEKPLNAAGVAGPLTATPSTFYADCLNVHRLLGPIVAVITKHAPFAFHYWDLEGHPVMYCRLGRMHSKKLMQELFALTPIDAEPCALALLFSTYALLVLEQLIRYCNRRNREGDEVRDERLPQPQRGSRQRQQGESCPASSTGAMLRRRPLVGSCIVVIDCAGLKVRRYLYRPLLLMVRSIVRMNMCDFPELLHHVYVTNCTNVVSLSYLMLRGILSRAAREKVTFCSKSNTAATLCECIRSDLVPQELGGQCQCPGGCISPMDATPDDARSTTLSHSCIDAPSSVTTQCGDTCTEQVTQQLGEEELFFHPFHYTAERLVLKARESRKLSFAMDAGSEIIWEFAVKHEQDVFFSAVFVSAGNDGAMLSLVPRRRVQNEAGHYISPSIGTVIFEWCNKHHFFTRCRLSLKVYRGERSVAST